MCSLKGTLILVENKFILPALHQPSTTVTTTTTTADAATTILWVAMFQRLWTSQLPYSGVIDFGTTRGAWGNFLFAQLFLHRVCKESLYQRCVCTANQIHFTIGSGLWFDNIHSMRALLGKQTVSRLVNVMWAVPYPVAQGEGNNEGTERKVPF